MTNTDHTSSLADAAYMYAQQGLAVFPLQPASKIPYAGTNGVKDATTSTAAIYDWWLDKPNSNIGYGIPDDIIVIDIDPRNGGLESEDLLHDNGHIIPSTPMTYSGRGDGGRHYFLRPPDGDVTLRGSLTAVGYPGIDIKKHGGYVLLPPSIHPETGDPYTWCYGLNRLDFTTQPVNACPPWLAELVVVPPTDPDKQWGQQNVTQLPLLEQLEHSTGPWNGDGLARAVRDAKEGDRNNTLNWALWQLRDDRIAGKCTRTTFTDALNNIRDAALHAGLTERETDRTIHSAFKGETS